MLKGADDKTGNTKRDNLAPWLQTGNVIYKSVGVGLMDLSIGLHIIEFAKQKGVGSHVQGF
jgi:ornithine cyclodeaminase/alanine dehydrogenase-like protein (mu-crystallin family)